MRDYCCNSFILVARIKKGIMKIRCKKCGATKIVKGDI